MNLSLKVSTASLRSLFLSLILLLCGIGILSPAQAMNFASNESAADDSKPAIRTQAQATNAKLELLIPLYIYPGTNWDKIVDASSQVPITVIINPASGPGNINKDSTYQNEINTLRRNGVKVLGYVHTKKDRGPVLRDLDDIKRDVDEYTDLANNFQLDGIFFDEVTSRWGNHQADFNEYQQLYNYVKSKSNQYLVVLNPGSHLAENYLNVGNTAIIFEAPGNPNHRYYRDWLTYKPDSYVSNYPSERFAFLEYDVRDADTMRDHILEALKRNIKYVYVTNDSGDNPWDTLPSYWQKQVDYIKELNAESGSPQPLTCMGHAVTIRGTEGPDTIPGTSGPDVIHGLGGNDTIYGNGGDDIICAGNGGDFVNGNQGNDQIDGGEGWDTLRGGKNDDTINGGPGNDKIYGDLGRDTINGNQGNDSIYGGAGNDTLRGGQNNDVINGNQGNDQVYGDKGNDTLRGGKNNDTINGGNGTDWIYGDRGVDSCSNGPHISGCER